MKKLRCPKCGRLVAIDDAGNFVKHRTKRGPANKKTTTRHPYCERRN